MDWLGISNNSDSKALRLDDFINLLALKFEKGEKGPLNACNAKKDQF